MTRQEIFDTVAAHLKRQGKKSADSDDTCQYRGPNYLQCAIGCLIPDGLYVERMEMRGLETIYDLGLSKGMPWIQPVNFHFLTAIQEAHDFADAGKWWLRDALSLLVKVANDYHLNPKAAL